MVTTVSRSVIVNLLEIILEGGAKKATKYLSPKLTAKATLQGKRRKNSPVTVLLTIGRPNYAERSFIKGQSKFPVKNIKIEWPK